ncbi:MAG TPA: DUF2922 domain-containing protein [Aminobacterium sp.]|jgi:hypothetical protein|uniref:DUF2922 domain-containing protein n=1 Tax=Aminobacterium TaxID=81466 RepID=UPI000465C90C|nr:MULTISPECIES: DUF2922 domain-containing protein [Aminobacterium]HCA41352.1 DUF2922 domain-containing protein [Aminobacterium sp.]
MKSVRLKFGTSDGKKRTISLRYPRADITEPEVRSAMQALIDNNIFVNGLTAIASAEMVETTVTPLIEG